MAQSDIYGLGASGISPEMQAEYRGLTRQQAIAEALMKQGMAPGGDVINAGKYLVKRSPLEGISKVLQAYMGQKQLEEGDAKFADLGKRVGDANAAELANYMQTKTGGTFNRPDMTAPGMTGGLDEQDVPRTPETVAPNARGAVTQAMLSRNPMMQKLGQLDYANMAKPPEKIDAGDKWLLIKDGVTVGTIPKAATPDAVARQAGENARHVMPSGNTAAQIKANEDLNAARAAAARAQAASAPVTASAAAANANYNSGSNIPLPIGGASTTPQNPPPVAAPPTGQRAILQAEIVKEQALLEQATDPAKKQLHTNNLEMLNKELSGQPGFVTAHQAAPNVQSQKIMDEMARDAAKATAAKESRPPSAAAQKAILEADNTVLATTQVIDYIKQAKDLNDKAMGFPGAATVSAAGSFLPESMRPPTVNQTQEMDNIIQTSVLPNLKSTFGGNPTEGERKILLEVAGSSNKNPAVRKGIFDRAEKAAKERMAFNEKRANDLRVGTYFTGGNDRRAPAAPTETGVRRYNPATGRIE